MTSTTELIILERLKKRVKLNDKGFVVNRVSGGLMVIDTANAFNINDQDTGKPKLVLPDALKNINNRHLDGGEEGPVPIPTQWIAEYRERYKNKKANLLKNDVITHYGFLDPTTNFSTLLENPTPKMIRLVAAVHSDDGSSPDEAERGDKGSKAGDEKTTDNNGKEYVAASTNTTAALVNQFNSHSDMYTTPLEQKKYIVLIINRTTEVPGDDKKVETRREALAEAEAKAAADKAAAKQAEEDAVAAAAAAKAAEDNNPKRRWCLTTKALAANLEGGLMKTDCGSPEQEITKAKKYIEMLKTRFAAHLDTPAAAEAVVGIQKNVRRMNAKNKAKTGDPDAGDPDAGAGGGKKSRKRLRKKRKVTNKKRRLSRKTKKKQKKSRPKKRAYTRKR